MPKHWNIQRYWDTVDKTLTCWNWKGSLSHGYGSCSWKSVEVGAHRIAYKLTYGDIPEGLQVLHRCDNRVCVNPEHLFLGTQRDNIRDMNEKGRHNSRALYGEEHWNVKLTELQVLEIMRKNKLGVTMTRLARDYGVSESAIAHICHNRSWRHLKKEWFNENDDRSGVP